jgi:O-antigen/teichoic acid export membrane protein
MSGRFLKKITKNPEFITGIRNVSFLGTGNILSQIIGFVGFIFIARLFGPQKYGLYATVLAFVTFFHLFILTGLSKAVVREGSKRIDSFQSILEETVGIRLFFVGAALFLCIASTFFTNYPDKTKVLIIIFSSEIIYFGLDSYLSTIYQTTQKMQYLAYFSVMTRILVTGASIIFLYLGAGVLVILVVNLTSKFIVLTINYWNSRRFATFTVRLRKVNLQSNILKPTLVFSLNKFIETFAVRIDLLMISFLSTSRDVGIYGVAHQIADEGIMLRNIAAFAFFPIAVKLLNKKSIRTKTLFSYSIALLIIVLLVCFILSFFIKDLVIFIFGEEYSYSGHILIYLIFFLCFAFFNLPLTTYLQATHNEHLLLIVFSIIAVVNISLNIIFFYAFGLIGIAYSTLAVFFVQSLLISLLTLKKLKSQKSFV